MTNIDQEQDFYSNKKTEQRREAALKRMLATPHKPHKPMAKKVIGRGAKRASAKPRSA